MSFSQLSMKRFLRRASGKHSSEEKEGIIRVPPAQAFAAFHTEAPPIRSSPAESGVVSSEDSFGASFPSSWDPDLQPPDEEYDRAEGIPIVDESDDDMSTGSFRYVQKKKRSRLIYILAAAAVALVGLIGIARSKAKSLDSWTQEEWETHVDRILDDHLPLPSKELLEQSGTPQDIARDWVYRGLRFAEKHRVLQRYALACFWAATKGSDWEKSLDWLSLKTECDWFQQGTADCCCETDENDPSRDQVLVELSLPSNSLQGQIPDDLAVLSSLRHVDLNDNAISGEIPWIVVEKLNLDTLDLSFNALGGTFPDEFFTLTDLRYLDVGFNSLGGSLPTEFGLLTNMEELFLMGNRFAGVIPSTLASMAALRELYVFENTLQSKIPSELGLCTSLKNLLLHKSFLSGTIPSELGQLTELKHMTIYGTEITGSIPSEVCSLNPTLEATCTDIECDCCTCRT